MIGEALGEFSTEKGRGFQNLRYRIEVVRDSIDGLIEEGNRVRREGGGQINLEKERIIKLEYECRLLNERESDSEKTEYLAEICRNQEELEVIVEEMLRKEDELAEELG